MNHDDDLERLLQRSRRVLDAETALRPEERRRLARARQQPPHRPAPFYGGVAVAAALLVAVLLWPSAPPQPLPLQLAALAADEFELLFDHGEVLEGANDSDFIAWALTEAGR